MIKILVTGVTLLLTPVLVSLKSVPPGRGENNGVQMSDLDRKVDPCTDFYEYANGTWRAENPIPASMQRWSRRVATHESNKQRVQAILDDLSRKKDWPSGSVEQLISDHYGSCMNDAQIETDGLTPLAPLLTQIDGMRDTGDLNRVIRGLHELAIAVPFGTAGTTDYHEPLNFIENVVAGGLGLPDRDYYLKDESRFVEAREKYRVHIAEVLKLSGMSEAQAVKAADDTVALETRLADVSLNSEKAADPAATDNKVTFAQLKQMAPHVDWEKYFDEAKLPRIDLNVAEPKFIAQLDKEIEQTPVATWKVYLRWHLLDSASPWLSKAFASESYNFTDMYLGKATEMKPRAQRCADSVDALLGEALGKKYVDRYFPPEAKAKANEIARNLMATLKDEVSAVQWMSPQTKKKALEKLAATNMQIGYPDKWKNYSGVVIRRETFWANIAAARKFNVDDDRRQVGKPTNRDGWLLDPSSPDAYLDLQLNKVVLPAGFMQPPYFDLNANDAVNYGGFGIAFSHDLTHAIDATGSETDTLGRPVNWWTDTDRKRFDSRAQCVVDQFEGYYIEPGVHHQGKRVLSEAIGDLAGVRIAYLALQKSMTNNPVPVVDGFTPEQQFFISWGQTSGHAMRLEAQRQLVSGDPHPTPKYRVIGPLSNSPEFQKAFSCKVGEQMVRSSEKRCSIW